MKKKDLAIVFGITKDLTFALANVLIGIRKHFSLKKYEIIIFHDGINKDEQKCLNLILPCEFVLYNKSNIASLNEEYLKIYSNMCLSRFECFDLLKKYKKIIWHDVDILIAKDFKDLLSYGDKSGLAMTYSDIEFMNEANFNSLIKNYNMFLPLLNSGIIVFSDKLKNYEQMSSWCYNMLEKLNVKLKYLDQGVLNLLVQEFNINVESIDINKYCCQPFRKSAKDAIIVHSYGHEKFWNSIEIQNMFPEWNENALEWGKIVQRYYNSIDFKPNISVLMSIYKRTSFLKEAIESILYQSYGMFELIIVVEYSEFQKEINKVINNFNDKRIVVINNSERLGFAESLNIGIKKARGKYIARMDDDDISLLYRLEMQNNYLNQHSEIAILGSAVKLFMNENKIIIPPQGSEKIKTFTLINNQMYHPTVMMRKSDIIKNSLFYNSKFKTEDAELWSRAVRKVKLDNLKNVLLFYRVSNENETQVAKKEVFNSDIRIIQQQLNQNLDLDINIEDVVYLSGRVSKYSYLNNNKEILTKKRKIAKMVYKKNKREKYYNRKYLAEVLELDKNSFVKKLVKKIIKPIYSALMFRIDNLIDEKIGKKNND